MKAILLTKNGSRVTEVDYGETITILKVLSGGHGVDIMAGSGPGGQYAVTKDGKYVGAEILLDKEKTERVKGMDLADQTEN